MVIRIVTGLWGDPLIVARTVLKLSNSVAAARPPFLKTSSVQVFKTRPGTLLIDMTKYASGVPGEYMYESYGIHLYEHAATVKLRACSYQRKDCCHGSESSSAIRPHAASSTRAARLRDGRSEASTVLKALLRLHSKVRVRSQL